MSIVHILVWNIPDMLKIKYFHTPKYKNMVLDRFDTIQMDGRRNYIHYIHEHTLEHS